MRGYIKYGMGRLGRSNPVLFQQYAFFPPTRPNHPQPVGRHPVV